MNCNPCLWEEEEAEVMVHPNCITFSSVVKAHSWGVGTQVQFPLLCHKARQQHLNRDLLQLARERSIPEPDFERDPIQQEASEHTYQIGLLTLIFQVH